MRQPDPAATSGGSEMNVDDPSDRDGDVDPSDEEERESDESRMAAVRAALESIGAPSIPVAEVWEVSVASLIRRAWNIPPVATRILGQADRLGALRLSPMAISMDRDEVEWSKITAARTSPVAEALATTVIEREVERLTKMLPMLPGRKWLARRVTDLLHGLTMAAIQKSTSRESMRHVVTEIEYRGTLGRAKTMSAGLVVTAVLGLVPGASDAIHAMAGDAGHSV